MFPIQFLYLFLCAALVSSIGFVNYVWFISIGYGFAISAQGLLMLILYRQGLTPGTLICCLLFLIYGIRLSGYLLIRELKITSYGKNMQGEIKDGKTVPFGVKVAIWLTCALLYVTQVSAVFYRLHNGTGSNACTYIGAAVMLFGLCFESAADIQKNAAKKINPRRFVDTGLFRIVRCPNYLGEMLFWTGVFLSGVTTLHGAAQWAMALVGYLGIIYVMFSGARRLEIRQNKNYGSDPEYQEYVRTTPIMVPFIPLYSVEKYKFLVG